MVWKPDNLNYVFLTDLDKSKFISKKEYDFYNTQLAFDRKFKIDNSIYSDIYGIIVMIEAIAHDEQIKEREAIKAYEQKIQEVINDPILQSYCIGKNKDMNICKYIAQLKKLLQNLDHPTNNQLIAGINAIRHTTSMLITYLENFDVFPVSKKDNITTTIPIYSMEVTIEKYLLTRMKIKKQLNQVSQTIDQLLPENRGNQRSASLDYEKLVETMLFELKKSKILEKLDKNRIFQEALEAAILTDLTLQFPNLIRDYPDIAVKHYFTQIADQQNTAQLTYLQKLLKDTSGKIEGAIDALTIIIQQLQAQFNMKEASKGVPAYDRIQKQIKLQQDKLKNAQKTKNKAQIAACQEEIAKLNQALNNLKQQQQDLVKVWQLLTKDARQSAIIFSFHSASSHGDMMEHIQSILGAYKFTEQAAADLIVPWGELKMEFRSPMTQIEQTISQVIKRKSESSILFDHSKKSIILNQASSSSSSSDLIELEQKTTRNIQTQIFALSKKLAEGEKFVISHETLKLYSRPTTKSSGRDMAILTVLAKLTTEKPLGGLDPTELIPYILNLREGETLGGDNLTPLENYFTFFASMLMFDDLGLMANEMRKTIKSIQDSNVYQLHLYNIDDTYIPLSIILFNLSKSISKALTESSDFNTVFRKERGFTKAQILWKPVPSEPRGTTSQDWEELANKVLTNTKLYLFMHGGFETIFKHMAIS